MNEVYTSFTTFDWIKMAMNLFQLEINFFLNKPNKNHAFEPHRILTLVKYHIVSGTAYESINIEVREFRVSGYIANSEWESEWERTWDLVT